MPTTVSPWCRGQGLSITLLVSEDGGEGVGEGEGEGEGDGESEGEGEGEVEDWGEGEGQGMMVDQSALRLIDFVSLNSK